MNKLASHFNNSINEDDIVNKIIPNRYNNIPPIFSTPIKKAISDYIQANNPTNGDLIANVNIIEKSIEDNYSDAKANLRQMGLKIENISLELRPLVSNQIIDAQIKAYLKEKEVLDKEKEI